MPTPNTTLKYGAFEKSMTLINQDNFGSTYFFRDPDGTEFEMKIRHSQQGKVSTGLQNRAVADLTVTSFDDDRVPTKSQMYTHIITPRGTDLTTTAIHAGAFAAFLTSKRIDLLNRISIWDDSSVAPSGS